MAIRTNAIYWMAGLLEGEGCFTYNRGSLCIHLQMADEDVVRKFADLVGVKTVQRVKRYDLTKRQMYLAAVYGPRATGIMMTVLPLLGDRRTKRVKELVAWWKDGSAGKPPKQYWPKGLIFEN